MKIHKNRILLIGSGNIFKKHILVLEKLKNLFEIVGIVEKNIKKINLLKAKYNYPVYDNLDYALNNSDFDIATILTDSGSHAKIAIKIINKKKSIIIEKPIAVSLKDAEKIVNLENKHKNLNIFVVKQNRFNLPIIKLKDAIQKKRFGKIFLATVRVRWKRDKKYYNSAKWRGKWKTDGGVLCNQAIHHIDLLQWLVGDVKTAFSMNSTISAPTKTEDTSAALLKFKNGATGMIEATTACRPDNLEGSVSILGTKGTVIVGGFSANKLLEWKFTNRTKDDAKIFSTTYQPNNIPWGHLKFYEYVNQFLKSKSKKKNNFLDAKEAIKSLRIVTALIKSDAISKPVKLNSNLSMTKLGK